MVKGSIRVWAHARAARWLYVSTLWPRAAAHCCGVLRTWGFGDQGLARGRGSSKRMEPLAAGEASSLVAPWWERGPGEAMAGRRTAPRQCEGRGLLGALAARLRCLPGRGIAFVRRMQRWRSAREPPALTHPADTRRRHRLPHAHPGAAPCRPRHAGATVQCRDSTPEHCTEERFASTQCSTVVDPATGEPVRHCVKLYRRYLKCAGRCAPSTAARLLPVWGGRALPVRFQGACFGARAAGAAAAGPHGTCSLPPALRNPSRGAAASPHRPPAPCVPRLQAREG